ncbi:Cse1-domain-containing protein [Aaosphaeria arxii CBS 175.79]|uniref:Cse1-domain-containing protein n=1 Tax=Aaosphaeria arxii CBS 175.79 TaxID=1450172 RepID=A0A6A5XR48_9PLEO|nr:Cse1-domain-containing protein [Aaosphaeria arxii CBS 175.79]KAF2015307.1 Cse1-domain-containing protein [Aaosphaeria arxii CBS 175.79]
MSVDISALSQLLQASLNPQQSKQAEAAIVQEQSKPNFSLALLQLVADGNQPTTIRLASALYFKNFIKRYWVDEDGNYKLPAEEVTAIKRELIGLMVSVPPNLQAQLGEAISAIADSDFWERWDTLVDDLISRLTPDNATVNNGVLRVAHSIFKRWRPLFRSDDLFTEINHVLTKFGGPFLTLMEHTDAAITNSQNNPQALKEAFGTLDLIVKLFYDLSCQDLPPVFEDNLPAIAGLLHKYLTYDSAALRTDDDEEAGIQEYVKAGIFEALMLYVQKYEDVFGPHLGQFIETTWNFLMSVGLETKYDILVSKALQFLTAVAGTQHAESFNNQGVLVSIIEKVILPNLTLRESDVELYEDEPIEFIRRDLEGSDNDTRRRAATEFLRQLMSRFEDLVTNTAKTYIDGYLQNYASNKQDNWKSKDTAVYLFSAIAAKGKATAAQGVISTNPNVNILEFFQSHIAEDLQGEPGHSILKVDSIKFVYVFRSQLSPALWRAAFPLLVNQLASSDYVVHTYAAIAVERALFMTDENRQSIIPQGDVTASAKDLLSHLFKLVTKDSKPEKIQENEFLMKCVMRVLVFIRDGILPITDLVLTNFINIVKVIRHNPSNPRFQYYLFEGLGALIRFAGPTQSEKLETTLYSPFAAILQEGVEEFVPYVFQLFAALLEANPAGHLTKYYQELLNIVILPQVWESRGNVPALVRLLTSMIPRDVQGIVERKQVEPILGIFQKLVSTKAHEALSFELIETMIAHIPLEIMQPYFVTIVQLMLTRLSSMKTEMFQQRFIAFYHFISARQDKGLGADFFITVSDQVQQDVFKGVYLTIILPDTQKLPRPVDRKTAVVSFTKTLTDSEAFVSRYPKGWGLTTQRLIELLINPPVPQAHDDIIPDADVDEVGFGVGFTQLNTCRKQPKDPFPEITDVKSWVGQYLKDANTRHNGKIVNLVQERLGPDVQSALNEYLR